MSNTYVIGQISVKDQEKWDEYRSQVAATLAPWGAELLFRGKLRCVFAGSHPHTDTVVIRFPDALSAERWHTSPAYQALIPLRLAAADVDLLCYDSDDGGAPG
jgi:uncharacterized protein (DUF1330 family)